MTYFVLYLCTFLCDSKSNLKQHFETPFFLRSDLKSAVCDHVSAQVAEVVETGGALFAGVGFLSRVSPQVDFQATAMREAFPTLGAGVRLLPRVNTQMNGQRVLFEKRLPAIGTNAGVLAHMSCPVRDQVCGTGKVLAAEAAVKILGVTWNEDVWLLGELADITWVSCLTISPNKERISHSCCHLSGLILLLTVSYHFITLILSGLHHGNSVSSTSGEIQEAVMGDIVVRRQRAKVLKFRGREEAVFHILQRAFPSPMDAQNSQLFASVRWTGGL